MMRSKLLVVLVLFSFVIPFLSRTNYTATAQDDGTTTRVSVASDGTQANGKSYGPSISADGRYVAFDSVAINLVAGDTNGARDIFVHDRLTGQTTRVSIASDGTPGNSASYSPTISADGRYVAFASDASNLVVGDSNVSRDVFVHDRQTGQTVRVSVASSGIQGNDSSVGPSISADGRYVAFQSIATTLVPGDTNDAPDVFVHDRETGQTTRVSVASDGAQGNGASHVGAISADGRFVVFGSYASNLGSDGNTFYDVFVHDRQTGQTTCVSVSSDGISGNGMSHIPSISADGRYVAFGSFATNLVPGDTNGAEDIFVHDRETGQTIRVSLASDGTQGNEGSYWPFISADARYVTFDSHASNLVPGDTNAKRDVFVHDLQTGQTTRESIAFDGAQSNDDSSISFISADGRSVAFWSSATNLVPGDTNGVDDIFVRDRGSSSRPPSECIVPSGINICDLEPGDILLETSPTGVLIGGFVATYWFHAGLYDEDSDGAGYVLEARGSAFPITDQVMRSEIAETGFYNGAGDWVVLRLKPEYRSAIPKALEWARYKAKDANAIYSLDLLDPRNKQQDYRFYCSLFVWRAYQEAFIDLDYDSPIFNMTLFGIIPKLTQQVLPDDIYMSSIGIPLLRPPVTDVVQEDPLQSGRLRNLVVLLSPADLRITDAEGNVTGVDLVTGAVINEIPGAFYSGPESEPEWVAVSSSSSLSKVEVLGTGTGEYHITYQVFEDKTVQGQIIDGMTQPGQTDNYVFPSTLPVILARPFTETVTRNNKPELIWYASSDGAFYQIQVDDEGDFLSPEHDSLVTGLSYIADSLAYGTTYHWRVRARSASGEFGPWSNIRRFTVDYVQPNPPKLNVPRDRTNTPDITPRFTWAAVRGADRYHLQVSAAPDFSALLVDDDTLPRAVYVVPNTAPLKYGTYYWRVRAHDVAGNWSGWSTANTFTVTLLKTPREGDFITATTPVLRWAGVLGATRYWLQVSTDVGFTDLLIDEDSLTRVAFTPADPLPFGPLYWRVQVDLGGGYPADPVAHNWTPAWIFTVTLSVPVKPALESPANRMLTDSTPHQLTWQPLAGGATYHYQVQLDNQANFRSPLQDVTLDPDVTTYIPAPLSENGRVFWRVRAINEHGVAGQWSPVWWFRLEALPSPVLTNPAQRSTTASPSPTFEWEAVPNAAEYQVQISADRRFATLEQAATVAGMTYPAGALPDGRYYWRVRGVNAASIGGTWSAVWQIIIDSDGPDAPVLSVPTEGSGTADRTPRLDWKASRGAVEYRVQIADNLAFDSPDEWAGVTSPYLIVPDAGALNYGIYFWRVQARDVRDVWGAWSQTGTFTVTVHKTPRDGAATTALRPVFRWAAVAGVTEYRLQISTMPDIDADPSPLVDELRTTTSYQPPAGLAYGTLYWRVSLDGGASWMPTWSVTITPAPPARVGLSAPRNRTLANDSTPTLMWKAALRGETYQVQIDDDRRFGSPAQDVTLGAGVLTHTADALSDGVYFWRVRALNAFDAPGPWSLVWRLDVDTVAPDAPTLVAPEDTARVTNRKLRLEWARVSDAVRYEVQLDLDPAFPLPPSDAKRRTFYRLPVTLGQNVYYWRARAVDKAGNVSAWSAPRSFSLVAGNTALSAPAVVPVLDDTLAMVEAEGASVTPGGAWTVQADAAASGGAYAVSSGAPGDVLEMTFSGTRLDVVYVQGPELGAFAVEVDGAVLLTVNSGVGEGYATAWAMLPDLVPGTHTLRILPIEDAVALDGFVVER